MKKKLRTLLTLVLSMLLILGTAVSVSASELDINGKGSITVQLLEKKGEHLPVDFAGIELYHVGDAAIINNTLGFTKVGKFSSFPDDINNFRNKALSSQLNKFIQDNPDIDIHTFFPAEKGKTVFQFMNLDAGLYLVRQRNVEKPSIDKYSFEPFVVSVPMMNDDGTGWNYHIKANPKAEIVGNPIDIKIIKEWKNADNKIKENPVYVQLDMVDSAGKTTVVNTVKLDKNNNWTETLSSLDGNASWVIKEVEVPSGYKATYPKSEVKNGVLEIKVVNTKIPPKPPLIQTGQLNWPIPLMAGLGLALILTGVVVSKHGRKKEQQ